MLGTKYDAENLENAKKLLKDMCLYEYKDSHPASLSGGQKQRLAVCCALLSGKDILILDEPTSGLDAENMFLIARELKKAAEKEKTILVIINFQGFSISNLSRTSIIKTLLVLYFCVLSILILYSQQASINSSS